MGQHCFHPCFFKLRAKSEDPSKMYLLQYTKESITIYSHSKTTQCGAWSPITRLETAALRTHNATKIRVLGLEPALHARVLYALDAVPTNAIMLSRYIAQMVMGTNF